MQPTCLLKKIISVSFDFFAVSMIFSLIFIWIQIQNQGNHGYFAMEACQWS